MLQYLTSLCRFLMMLPKARPFLAQYCSDAIYYLRLDRALYLAAASFTDSTSTQDLLPLYKIEYRSNGRARIVSSLGKMERNA